MNNENNTLIAKRYAEALIDLGKTEKISLVSISADLANIQLILTKSKDLFDVLTNPMISVENKEVLISEVFGNEIDPLVANFLKLLSQKNRFGLIYDIFQIFNKLLDDINNIARIEVISAIELNDSEQADIQAKLASKLKKQIVIKYNIDKSLIAGLVVKMGDDVMDMSVARKLDEYKMALIK
ncbi:ATP synthase F1 subunit delta [bacterium]|nr:ATP synthase F1 subunit delta [bacterium]